MTTWKNVNEELPPEDGLYLVRSAVYSVYGELRYNGYGFLNQMDCYCYPDEWAEIPPPPPKRYGKVTPDNCM